MSTAGVKNVVSQFSDARADYDMSKASRFIRRRTGVAPTGAGENWNYRSELKYYQDIEQARDMDRNDGLVGTLADRRVDNIVQQGFTLDTKTGDKALDQDLWARWQAFANDPEMCDIAGEMTFHEMERFVCRAESIDGDIVGLGTESGPLQLHEAHAIQTSTKIEDTFLGVTRSKFGRRETYHFRYDLNEFGQKSESEPVSVRNKYNVRQLFHVYNPKRVSATRGVTQLAPVFSLSGMLEDINFAKLVQQQIVSCFAILAEKSVNSNGNLPNVDGRSKFGEPATENTGSGTRQLEGISPGMFYEGKEGEKLTGFSPNVPNSEYFQQVKLILQIVGVNFGLPLCLVLMDGSETNFSGWRGAVDEARKGFVADQLNLVRRWHSPVYRWWLHRGLALDKSLRRAAERKGIDIFGHTWQLPTWSYIEPVADAEGDTAQLRNALTSPRRMHAARGKDWETIAEEIIDDNVYAIEKAQAKADKHNQKFPQAPPLSWRDLIPLPMPEGQTMALQDPAAVAAQEEKTDAPPAKPVARRKKKAVAANDGKWRSTDDGGKIFIGEDGDPKFGGPNGPALKKADAPAKTTTHNIKLPKRRASLTGDQATSALKGMGIIPGKAETKLNPETKKFETSRELTMPDGTKVRKTATEITTMVYEGADDFIPKKKAPVAADDGEWRTTKDGGKIFIGDDGTPNFGGPNGPPVKQDGGQTKQESAGTSRSAQMHAMVQYSDAEVEKLGKATGWKIAKTGQAQSGDSLYLRLETQEGPVDVRISNHPRPEYRIATENVVDVIAGDNASEIEKLVQSHIQFRKALENGDLSEQQQVLQEAERQANKAENHRLRLAAAEKRLAQFDALPDEEKQAVLQAIKNNRVPTKDEAPTLEKSVRQKLKEEDFRLMDREAKASVRRQPKAAEDGEWRSTKDGGKIFIGPGGDPKFGGPQGPDVKEDGGQKSAGVKSADLSLPDPKMKVSTKSSKLMEEMIKEDLQQGKTLEQAFEQYDDGGWDYLDFSGKQSAISKVERALDKHDAKSGKESGTTDEIDGQHWEDWISDNYTGPVEDKLINEFKDQMRAKFGAKS